jgi:hypothetical protein
MKWQPRSGEEREGSREGEFDLRGLLRALRVFAFAFELPEEIT